jgi:hypothetical protein
LFVTQLAQRVFQQPVEWNLLFIECVIDAFEIRCECAIELVEMRFILDQRQSCKIVEIIERLIDDVFVECFQQQQEFLDRNGNAGIFQREEEIDQHGICFSDWYAT